MIRYYCSGFDVNNAFGHGLGEMFKADLKDTKRIVYIPGGSEKVEKVKTKQASVFDEYFKNVGIKFERSIVITPDMEPREAQKYVADASFIMLMGGNPFSQKEMCEKLGLMAVLQKSGAVMLGFSAGAMLMSKYMIITPCSEEYPDFRIEKGLNLDGISIYPHNNTNLADYPERLTVDKETWLRKDLIRVAREYGEYYLLQDFRNENEENDVYDISYLKCKDGRLGVFRENGGKIWVAGKDCVRKI